MLVLSLGTKSKSELDDRSWTIWDRKPMRRFQKGHRTSKTWRPDHISGLAILSTL